MLEKILAKLVSRTLRTHWLAFINVDFLLCYQNIYKIGNNLHNFNLRVSSR